VIRSRATSRTIARDHALGLCGSQPGINQLDHLLDREAVRDHDRLGAAVAAGGERSSARRLLVRPTLYYAQASAVLDHSITLPQGDGNARPTLARGEIGGERNLIVLERRRRAQRWFRRQESRYQCGR
jgi:hypothetical protein